MHRVGEVKDEERLAGKVHTRDIVPCHANSVQDGKGALKFPFVDWLRPCDVH